MNNQKLQLGDVQETALIPLSNRATETMRKNPRVRDEKAAHIIRELGIDTKKYDKLMTHECVIARTIMFDNAVKDLLKKYPDAVCLNLGCGMDDRFSRVDNGKITWFDVDLPDSIEVRRKLYEDTNRRKMIAGSVLELDWLPEVQNHMQSGQKLIAIAEGLLMYFSKEENQRMLNNLANHFSDGFFVVELMRPITMQDNMHETVKKTNAKFGWGTSSGHEFEALEPKMKLLSEDSFSKQMMKSTVISKILGFLINKVNNRIAVYAW